MTDVEGLPQQQQQVNQTSGLMQNTFPVLFFAAEITWYMIQCFPFFFFYFSAAGVLMQLIPLSHGSPLLSNVIWNMSVGLIVSLADSFHTALITPAMVYFWAGPVRKPPLRRAAPQHQKYINPRSKIAVKNLQLLRRQSNICQIQEAAFL